MKQITLGIFAHVDGGKTTLTEAMLFKSNAIRKLGRVDHQDSLLDNNSQERDRGITIFSKLAIFDWGKTQFTLVDTPGHLDFAMEAERVMGVLDYAILVVDGKEGVQPHTKTLFELLEEHGVPVFVFVNKMDMNGADGPKAMEGLKKLSKGRCVEFCQTLENEEVAMASEKMMEDFLASGRVQAQDVASAVAERKLIPVYFGSALKVEGVEELLEGLHDYAKEPERGEEFGAKVFKIERDHQGKRLTYMKLTGGSLKVRDEIPGLGEKVSQIRIYSGGKFETRDRGDAGQVIAVPGLENTFWGQELGGSAGAGPGTGSQAEGGGYAGRSLGAGSQENGGGGLRAAAGRGAKMRFAPVFHYKIEILEGGDAFTLYSKLKELEEEEPTINLRWEAQGLAITLDLMGMVQVEVLTRTIQERFGFKVELCQGDIIYKETIGRTVEGVGHYEPLKHYAEVHLLMEPLEEGSGLVFESRVSEDVLDRNWQRLIMTHLMEKEHLGALTASPITDMKISIVAGKAHLKHTEGGDFRQATYRAVRNGLMQAMASGDGILLEPWYSFELLVPAENVGRAMTDIENMGGQMEAPESLGDMTLIQGTCPAKEMASYHQNVISYTKGKGNLSVKVEGYRPCHNMSKIVESFGYDPDRDVENSADSIFCQHGAGVNIKWDQVEEYMHIPYQYRLEDEASLAGGGSAGAGGLGGNGRGAGLGSAGGGADEDSRQAQKELDRIFERTYGSIEKPRHIEKRQIMSKNDRMKDLDMSLKDEFLVVDGYNLIFAWPQLKELSQVNLDSARDALVEILANYQGFRKCKLMVVFDSYKVKGAIERIEDHGEIQVAFTKEGETADTFIEKLTYGMRKEYSVRVATSDALEQNSIFAHGCVRVSARELIGEIEQVEIQIKEIIAKNNSGNSRNRIPAEMFEK